jgi:N4-gp56 family major capsid protein
MSTYSGNKYNSGTDATSGPNVRVDYLDRKAIKLAVPDLIFSNFADARTQQRNSGKTFKVPKIHHILRDINQNDQGIDGEGNIIGNTSWIFNNVAYADQTAATAAKSAYDATDEGIAAKANNVEPLVIDVTTGGGNLYGSSRNVGNVVSGLPSLAEGASDVNRVGVTRENLETTLRRRGNYIEYTDEVELFSDINMVMEYKTKLARLAIEVRDDEVQLGMLGGAGVRFYSGTATSLATVGNGDEDGRITYDFIRKIAKRLKTNLAEKNASIITGSQKFGTTTVNSAYYAICGQDVTYDLESIAEYSSVEDYAYAKNLARGEVGKMHETRFVETTRMMKYEGAGATVGTNIGQQETNGKYDVFPIVYPTKGSYAVVGLQGKGGITFKAKEPGKATDTDKYGLKGFHSYSYFFASLALQSDKLLVAYVTASI